MFPEISPPFVLQWRSRRLARPESVEWIATTRGVGARNPVASAAREISRRRQDATRSCPAAAARFHADRSQVIALHFRFAAAQFERVCTRVRHDQINVLLQWNNLALFFEAARSGRPRPRE